MTISFARHQFPPSIIRHTVWLHVRFTLSYRDVEDLLAERSLEVSYETVRRWVLKFGPLFPRELRHRRPRPTARWHLDEMAVMIAGRQFWLWRAVDDEGEVLDLLVQPRRDKAAATKLMRKLLKKQGFAPDVWVTDKLRSYGAAKSQMELSARHDQGRRANNRAENSHQPTRRRERKMQRFKSPGSAQRFLSIHAAVQNTINVQRHLTPPHASRSPRRSIPDMASRHRGVSQNWDFQICERPNPVLVTAPLRVFSTGADGSMSVRSGFKLLELDVENHSSVTPLPLKPSFADHLKDKSRHSREDLARMAKTKASPRALRVLIRRSTYGRTSLASDAPERLPCLPFRTVHRDQRDQPGEVGLPVVERIEPCREMPRRLADRDQATAPRNSIAGAPQADALRGVGRDSSSW
jgi:putative transposase